MLNTPKQIWKVLLVVVLLTGVIAAQDVDEKDDQEPDARVARISILEGKAQIKRVDAEEWETAVLNLPIVEGDSIQTEGATKLEIQFDDYSYLRMNENTSLKFTVLADEGIALSIPKGLIGVSLIRFDVDASYFEIDAPKSTVTIQKKGTYRINAGDDFNKEVRVSVKDDGEARVYSTDSGFALKTGRVATLTLAGTEAGEWETSRDSKRLDAFDYWLQERDETIARTFSDQADQNDRYVDQDVYGDDDLDRNGDWVYTQDYGNVWRPSSRATSRYLNWSPYRYGEWRWLPYYGWTWVNDEPWGWATYHSGRWIHYRGGWVWSPYRRYSRGRSWWRPALVFVTFIGSNYCWYPLPYGYGYYDYNRRFRNRWKRHRRNRRNNNGNGNGNTPTTRTIPQANVDRRTRNTRPPLDSVPVGGVVTIPAGRFGRTRRGTGNASLNDARKVLSQKPVVTNSPPLLPTFDDNDRKIARKRPAPDKRTFETKTGAAPRTSTLPLDRRLKREKIEGNRTPVRTKTKATINSSSTRTRRTQTGVFERNTTTKAPVRRTTRTTVPRTTRTTRKTVTKSSPPVKRSTTTVRRTTTPKRPTPTRSKPKPPPTRSAPRRSAPTRSRPKPPPTRSAPRRPAPTRSRPKPPPTRSAPRRPAPTRSRPKPPPTRSAPKRAAPKRSAPKRSAPKKSKPKTKSSSLD